jgi:hypothetical protein
MVALGLGNDLAVAAAQSEDVTTIINIAATAEAMAVTLLGAAIAGAAGYTNADGSKGLAAPLVTILKAAQSAEQAHYAYLTGAGAKPLTTTFNIPDPKIATDTTTLFKTLEALETAFISAYEAAANEFSAMGKSPLVKVALQIGAVEGEHRALARLAQGDSLPHNVAFEAAQFATVGDAAKALMSLGFIGGTGTAVNYADFAGKVDNTGMSELTPGGVAASTTGGTTTAAPAPTAAPATAPAANGGVAQTPAQVPAQMPNTGAGGMARQSSVALLPAAVVGGLVMAAIGLRNRRVVEK